MKSRDNAHTAPSDAPSIHPNYVTFNRRIRGLAALTLACSLAWLAACTPNPVRIEPVRIVEDAHSGGNALAISPDSRFGASAGWAGRVRLWQLPDGAPLAAWQTPHGDLVGLMFLPHGDRLLSTGRDGFIRIWDLGGRPLAAYAVGSPVTSFHPAGDAGSAMLGHADGRVTHWSVDGKRLGLWELSSRRITAVASNSPSTHFAAGDFAGQVWRWRKGDMPQQLQSPASHTRSLAFNPVNNELLGGGWFDLFGWPADSAQLRVISTAHRGIVNHLQFTADGRYVASISRQTDSAILLLDPQTGKTLAGYKKHALCGQRVALSPDGQSMISNSDDASVRFYTLPEVPLQDNPTAHKGSDTSGG